MAVDVAAAVTRFANEDLAGKVQGWVRGVTREQAEDAVQDALLIMLQKRDQLHQEGNIRGWVLRTATNRARAERALTARRPTVSIDALPDNGERLIHGAMAADRPSPARGPQRCATGSAHHWAKFTDEQISEVRRLLDAGHTARDIASRTGVSQRHVYGIRYGEVRHRESFGWPPERIVAAFQAFQRDYGRPPRWDDPRDVRSLPSSSTVRRVFGTWQNARQQAGLAPGSTPRTMPRRWTREACLEGLRDFYDQHGRWPKWYDLDGVTRTPGRRWPNYTTLSRYWSSTAAAVHEAAS